MERSIRKEESGKLKGGGSPVVGVLLGNTFIYLPTVTFTWGELLSEKKKSQGDGKRKTGLLKAKRSEERGGEK